MVSEAARIIGMVAVVLVATFGWRSIAVSRIDPTSPERLVGELHLAQLAALVLVLIAGSFVGLAAAAETQRGSGLDIAFALGFLMLAVVAPRRDPREALTLLAIAFAAQAGVCLLHAAGILSSALAPPWYSVGCAVSDIGLAGFCYYPLLNR